MGDMLRKAYGDEYPNFYRNLFGDWDIREGTTIEYEDDFPTADEMRNREEELNTADKVILNEIKTALKESNVAVNQVLYEGELSSTVVKYLCEKGYKVDHIRSIDNPCIKISW